jgi:tripeptidyl-peptidase I
VNGANGPTENRTAAGAEVSLDFQLVMPLVWPQETVLWQVEDEYYQKNQSTTGTVYKGFFNSKL